MTAPMTPSIVLSAPAALFFFARRNWVAHLAQLVSTTAVVVFLHALRKNGRRAKGARSSTWRIRLALGSIITAISSPQHRGRLLLLLLAGGGSSTRVRPHMRRGIGSQIAHPGIRRMRQRRMRLKIESLAVRMQACGRRSCRLRILDISLRSWRTASQLGIVVRLGNAGARSNIRLHRRLHGSL